MTIQDETILESKDVETLINENIALEEPKQFIPFSKQTISTSDIESVIEALKSDYLTTGSRVKLFEDKICDYTGAKYAVALSSGTAALHLASLVLLEEGDKVLTTPNSFISTSNSILYVNADPIFVDIAEDGNIDLDKCISLLEEDSSIKAIYGTHFSGNALNQHKLKEIKDKYDVLILEDCAHSIGADFEGIKAGSCANSDCSILSFHPVKQLTTGEGGAITTNDEVLYEKFLTLRNHGMRKERDNFVQTSKMYDLGFNYRLSDIHCALGISQFDKFHEFIALRHEIAKRYDDVFADIDAIKPLYPFTPSSSYHIYVVRVDFSRFKTTKEELFRKMREKEIGLFMHYPSINKQPFYEGLGYGDEDMPNMDKYEADSISLPIYPTLSREEQAYVIWTLFESLEEIEL
jgi:dTDP-4-amino-4,6-dideoxygalactose transaminase